jgi:multidrug efflux pump subunit AcrA (membrane-fusion protein)
MRLLAVTGVTMFILLVIVILLGIRARERAESKLRQNTNEAAVEEVVIIHPKQNSPIDEVVLPGETQPYINSPVYARASGYLVKWYHDIGSRVKKGEICLPSSTRLSSISSWHRRRPIWKVPRPIRTSPRLPPTAGSD